MKSKQRDLAYDSYHHDGAPVGPMVKRSCTGSIITQYVAKPTVDFVSAGLSEDIRYTNSSRKSSNYCRHRRLLYAIGTNDNKTVFSSTDGAGIYDYGPSGYWPQLNKSCFDQAGRPALDARGLTPGWSIGSPHKMESVIINDMFEQARGMRSDLLLNLFELRQLPDSFRHLTTQLPDLFRNWKNIQRSASRLKRKGKLTGSAVSSTYLAYKFGIESFARDVLAAWDYLKHLKRDYEAYCRRAPVRIVRTYDLPVAYTCPLTSTTYVKYWSNAYYSAKPQMRYVLIVRPRAINNNELLRKLEFAITRFASSPTGFLWEKTKFSFLFDWFVDIRSALRAIDTAIGHQPFEVVSFTRSIKYELVTQVGIQLQSCCVPGEVLDDWTAFTSEYKYYERNLVSASRLRPALTGDLGKNQFAALAALITQRLSRVRGNGARG